MPNRLLKESICTSDSIDRLTPFQETMFYRLIVNCDDYGRFDGRSKIIAAKLFPLKDIRATQIEDALRALTSAELVTLYTVGGKPFLQMNTWDRHQQVRAKKSKYPSPDSRDEAEDITCNQMISDDIKCPRNPIQSYTLKETTLTGSKEKRDRFSPPTVEEVAEYCKERSNNIDPAHFVDYYAARGWEWKKGQKIKDWRACVRTWEQRESTPQKPKLLRAQDYEQREYNEADMVEKLGADDMFREAAT